MAAGAAKTAAKLAYVVGMLAFAAAGTANMVWPRVEDAKLNGVEAAAKRPELTWQTARAEGFQKDFTAWFEQHWGLRGYAVRTDNTIVKALFHEVRAGQATILEGGLLMSREDLNYVNRDDPPGPTVAYAKKIARVQAGMRDRNVVVIPVLIPAKTSFFRESIPRSWQRRGAFGLSDENLYRTFVRTLRELHVAFVDARELLSDGSPDHVFASPGRHWRLSAGCRTLQAAVDAARPDLPEIGTDQFDCTTHINHDADVEEEDYDLFRLLNVWEDKPAGVNVEVLSATSAPASLRVSTVFVGTSFVWKFVRIAKQLEVLRPALFYSYNSSVVDGDTLFIFKKVEPFTDAWRKDTLGKRLIIVGILETYLPTDGNQFFTELEEELDVLPPIEDAPPRKPDDPTPTGDPPRAPETEAGAPPAAEAGAPADAAP